MAQPTGEWDGTIRLTPGPHSSVVGYAKAGMAKTNNAPIAISPSIVLGATTSLEWDKVADTYTASSDVVSLVDKAMEWDGKETPPEQSVISIWVPHSAHIGQYTCDAADNGEIFVGFGKYLIKSYTELYREIG